MDTIALRNALPAQIATERLVLRAPTRADVPALAELANDRALYERLARLPHPYTHADAIAFIELIAPRADHRAYAITLDGAFVGVVSLMFESDTPELGYWLGQAYWRRGIMREAVAGLLQAVRTSGQFQTIKATALDDNEGSLAVLDGAGFKRVGKRPSKSAHHNGQAVVEFLLEGIR